MLQRLHAWLAGRKGPKSDSGEAPAEDRSSGEDAVETAEEVAAESTPSNMTRVKTDRL
jgi:hypothetical protein